MAMPITHETGATSFSDVYRPPRGAVGWLAAVAHKRIGVRYVVTAIAFMVLGVVEALLVRTQLAAPDGGILDREAFARMFTLHGATMVFLFAIPIVLGLTIYLVPLTIGSRDLPLPGLAQFSYWCYLAGGLFLYVSTIGGSAPDVGFSAPTPLSGPVFSPGQAVDAWLAGTTLVEIAALAAAASLFAAVLTTRAPGMSLWQMPMLAWAALSTSVLVLVGVAPLLVGDVMLASDRTFGTWFFEQLGGGSPLLWDRLWWIGGIPQVALLLAVPGIGIASQVVESASGRSLVGRSIVIASIVGLTVVDLAIWISGNRAGEGLGGRQVVPTILALLALVPFTAVFVSWAATGWAGALRRTSAVAFVVAGAVVGMLGVSACAILLVPPFADQVHGSQFAIGAMHLLLFGALVFPVLAALTFWYPKLAGRLFPEGVGFLSAAVATTGVAVTFVPLLFAGLLGMPRRIATYPTGSGWAGLSLLSTIGAYVLVVGLVLWLVAAVVGRLAGRSAPRDPWGATTLEWSTASPPDPQNFDRPPLLIPEDRLGDRWRRATALAERLELGPGDVRATLTTSVLDARPTGVAVLSGPTIVPIVVVAGLVVALAGMATRSIWTAIVGAVVLATGSLLWLVSYRRVSAEVAVDLDDTSDAGARVPGPSAAASVGGLLAGGGVLVAIVLGEAFLWSQASAWPPLVDRAYPPPGALAVAAVVCVVVATALAWVPIGLPARGSERNDREGDARDVVDGDEIADDDDVGGLDRATRDPSTVVTRVVLIVSALLFAAAAGCWIAEGFMVEFQPSNDAYTASFFLFLTVAVAAAVLAIVAAVNAIVRATARRRTGAFPAAAAAAFAGGATIVAWVMVVLIPQLTAP